MECQLGKYQDETNHKIMECKICAAGQYGYKESISTSSYSYYRYGCKNCEAGEYQDSTGQTECKDCAAGKYSTFTYTQTIENNRYVRIGATSEATCQACDACK